MLHGLGEVYRVSEKNAMEIQQAVVHHITQAKHFNFYIGRKSCYLAVLPYSQDDHKGQKNID
jgi:hypothetical protein